MNPFCKVVVPQTGFMCGNNLPCPYHKEEPFKKGDKVRIKKGTLYHSTKDGDIHEAGRTYTVTVWSYTPAYISPYSNKDSRDNMPARLTWAGSGGYWCWCDPTDVEKV